MSFGYVGARVDGKSSVVRSVEVRPVLGFWAQWNVRFEANCDNDGIGNEDN